MFLFPHFYLLFGSVFKDVTFVDHILHWIGLRENLQETMVFTIKYGVVL